MVFMEKEKVLFVYNPRAGKGTLQEQTCRYHRYDDEKTVGCFDCRQHRRLEMQSNISYKRESGCDRVICSGGDGTLHEVIHGLMTLPPDMRPACGYIPTGTVNDFANSIMLPKRVIP